MLKKLIVIFVLLLGKTVYSQKASDKINISSINFSLIDHLFNEKLNDLRKSKGASVLSPDAVLKKAAQDQADFMNVNDTLTHARIIPAKKNPSLRVLFYGGQNDGVGENVLFNFINIPTTSKYTKETTTINTYEEAAEAVFQSWKHSPGHYKNMIEPKYDVQGIAFSFNPKTKKMYASQVFGMTAYKYDKKIQPLLSDYHIKPFSQGLCGILKDENINGVRVANRIYVLKGKIYFDVQNTKPFTRAFKDPFDMLAIDIVFKNQFVCEKNNKLNGSPYYDGMLLKPVSFQELFKRNVGANGRLTAYLCDLPAEVAGMDYQLNAVLLKSNCFCSYTYLINVESKSYDLINLQPFWDTVRTTLVRDTFNLTIRQKVLFDKGQSKLDSNSLMKTEVKLLFLGQFAKAIKLNAYSSVEGDEKINKEIQEKRAKVIVKELQPYIPKGITTEINAQENWGLFLKQIPDTKYYYLYALDKPAIKKELKDSLGKRLEKQLNEERYSEFEIKIEGAYYDSSSADILSLGLMKALNEKNLTLAHSIQSKLIYKYLNDKASIDQLSQYPFPDDTASVPYIINLLAAKCINPNDPDYYNKRKLMNLFKQYSSNKKVQYNFCIYAINYWATESDTLINPKKLLDLVSKCKTLAPERAVNSMLLNYYLAAVKYYSKINNIDLMGENLDNIHALFQTVKLDENSSYKLALYFCDYNMTNWAVELLEPYALTTKNDKVIHLYLAAGAIDYHPDYPEKYTTVLDRYIQLFPNYYNSWIEHEYQLLREPIFKTRYCKK
jgi:uncharacterized protein YkwD